MNVAYLDPPYSRYFHHLCRRLEARTGGRTVALLSCPAYRLYTRGDRSLVWQPGTTSARHAVPEPYRRAEWASDSAEFAIAFSHAVEWFEARFRAERIDVCFAFSDVRPFSAAAAVAAAACGVVVLYFERGAFRLHTASLSTQGLNARFDLTAAPPGPALTGLAADALPPRRREETLLRTRFAFFMLLNALSCRATPARQPMQHKSYHLFNYARIAMRQLEARLPRRPPPHDRPASGAVATVLLPLQLQTDSQFVMYSPFRHNQELIDFVVPRVREALPGATVLVKRHPMDVRDFRLPEGAVFVDGNLAAYHRHAALMVCLNSGAGFEAAVHGKPVLCFADSFYTGCRPAARTSRETFVDDVRAAVQSGDDAGAGARLRAEVLRSYQAPGDVWAYEDADLDATVGAVLQHVAAARPVCAA
jgi:capsular polysaccharide export protein